MEKDMAICLVFFNPANTFRILMNLLYTINRFKRDDLPVFVLELVYEGRKPHIPDAIHVYAKSYMFHKENLCRVLEKHIPEKYTKLAFFDGDLIYKNADWYFETSKLLDEFDAVQPFETCHWLDLTYTKVTSSAKTICLTPDRLTTKLNEYHPGFAWCFRREWYNKVGFFDEAVVGSGDSYSAIKYINGILFNINFHRSGLYATSYESFIKLDSPTLTYVKNTEIFHLFHGKSKNRKYASRYDEIFYDITDTIENLIYKNEYGVYEWKDIEKMNPRMLKYFQERFDDDLSK